MKPESTPRHQPPQAKLGVEQVLPGYGKIKLRVRRSGIRALNEMSFDQFFNLGEGLLWLVVAAVFVVRTATSPKPRWSGYGAAVSFALFGLSDFIEVQTRAWYSPWPLLALKIACVMSLGAHLFSHLRQKNNQSRPSAKLDHDD